jgi:hypothetical protein
VRIARNRIEDPAVGVFFNSIEKLARIARRNKINNNTICHYNEIDKHLSHLISGELSEKEASRFLYSLTSSEVFYKRVLQKIIESCLNQSELSTIYPEMRNDEEILNQIKEISISRKKKNTNKIIRGYIFDDNMLMSGILLKYRLVIISAILIITIASGFLILEQNKNEAKLSEFDVFQQTVPFLYTESGLRDIEEVAVNPKEVAFYEKYKISMTDFVSGKYDQAVEQFRKGLPDVVGVVHNPLMVEVVRNYFFYWGISRLVGIKQKKQISIYDRQRLLEVIGLLTTALSIAKTNKLDSIDREEFFLGLTFGLAGEKEKAYEYLGKIISKSKFHNESQVLLEMWKSK